MLYILSGQDDFSLGESLEEIKRGLGDQALLAANTTILDGQQATPDQLRAVCETVPFLSERRLVIVKGLLERFEPRSKSSSQKKITPVTNQRNEYKLLVACINEIPDSTILVLIDGRLGRNNPLFKALSARAEVKTFPLLRNTKLRQWIQRHVIEEGGSISPGAVDLLAKLVGSNLWIMKSEINKLALFTSGRRIEEEDVKRVVSYAQQANVFAMVDAILEFKAGIAEQSLHQLLERGAAPAYLLVMLSRQVQMIVRVKELRNQGKPEVEIQNKLGLTSEFALRKTLERAGRYPLERLKEVYHKLLETDLSIKTGKYGGELALSILIAELCQRRKI
ncbi:MAG: DNA polymerase III subunit delta [Dehalococcoidia bacterium]|nr:MAG: DNA polymerase III subunit delta [Dehalococcoidia bacterium]